MKSVLIVTTDISGVQSQTQLHIQPQFWGRTDINRVDISCSALVKSFLVSMYVIANKGDEVLKQPPVDAYAVTKWLYITYHHN